MRVRRIMNMMVERRYQHTNKPILLISANKIFGGVLNLVVSTPLAVC
jgi:hypothetical protein